MPDRLTPEQRKKCMSRVKGKNTTPELLVRKALFHEGFRYRINDKKLAGHPDIVLKKYKTVIFINGCFWHGHENCKKASIPQTNVDFWRDKIAGNMKRDATNVDALQKQGWKVLVVWECELTRSHFSERLSSLIKEITA